MASEVILSIITINWNNCNGLERTMESVSEQTVKEVEYIVIDGGSTDGSVEVIRRYEDTLGDRFRWVSEKDEGIYNAMNKGLAMATGDYVEFLNSGDCLASTEAVEKMVLALEKAEYPSILYGNMIKCYPDGKMIRDKCFAGQPITMLGMYSGTLNHNPAYIKKELFEKYGYYDDNLKICSDWKWFMKTIIFGDEKAEYTDLDVTTFDMTGISEDEDSRSIITSERRQYLETRVPSKVLKDYDMYASDIYLMRRIHRFKWAFKLVYFLERCLSKYERFIQRKTKETIWG